MKDRVKGLSPQTIDLIQRHSTQKTLYRQAVETLVHFKMLPWPLSESEHKQMLNNTAAKHVKARVLIFWKPEGVKGFDSMTDNVKLWHYVNNVTATPTCYCGNYTRWSKRKNAYTTHCSNACRAKDQEVETKRKKTCIEKYGYDKSLKEKKHRKQTRDVLEERTGVRYPFQDKNIQAKSDKAKERKYGPDWKQIISQRAVNSLTKKYGGTSFGAALSIFGKRRAQSRTNIWLPKRINAMADNVELISSVSEFENRFSLLTFRCVNCSTEFQSNLENGKTPKCPLCFPPNSINWKEQELIDFCLTLSEDVITNTRQIIPPLELDVYFPQHKIAIEFNGLYWHSDVGSRGRIDSRYHLRKTQACEEQGIRLIHIFEDEWTYQPDVVKGLLSHIINNHPQQKIYARQTEIREITSDEYRLFVDKYHLQGSRQAPVRYGLWYRDTLVAVMSFGKSRYTKHHEWEMIRLCYHPKFQIVGGASKLFNRFVRERDPSSVISYSDRRWFTGTIYEHLNMKLIRTTPPGYFYVNLNEGCPVRLNRLQFQKHKLPQLLDRFDDTLTEHENMKNHGYGKIWDVGQHVFEWRK